MQEVETAFDFAAAEPTQLVRSLEPHLLSYRANNSGITQYPVPLTVDRIGNSLSVRLQIRTGVSLRVYAKTNRRVRFEIIHDEINVRELLGEQPLPITNPEARPSRPWSQVIQCFEALREKAANEMNELLQHLRRVSSVAPSHISPLSFLVAVADTLRDRELAHTVVSILTNVRGIICSRGTAPELLAAARTLTDAGLLKFSSEQRGYVPAPDYASAVALLSGVDALYLQTTARRRRSAR